KLFDTVEFPAFIGYRIYRAGAPVFTIDESGKYGFLNTDLLHAAMINLPFYIKILLRLQKMLKKEVKR
ncbi:MAG: hypothetical protein PHS59_18655, partial [Paludibacter sp.]|nr:hypothetical protein [Paludibacter sp.]